MSQFILYKSSKYQQPDYQIKRTAFLQHQATKLTGSCSDIYSIPDFDEVCIKAQANISKIETTELYQKLLSISHNEIYLWYGSESEDLEEVSSFDEMIEKIKCALAQGSGDIYLHYLPETKDNLISRRK